MNIKLDLKPQLVTLACAAIVLFSLLQREALLLGITRISLLIGWCALHQKIGPLTTTTARKAEPNLHPTDVIHTSKSKRFLCFHRFRFPNHSNFPQQTLKIETPPKDPPKNHPPLPSPPQKKNNESKSICCLGPSKTLGASNLPPSPHGNLRVPTPPNATFTARKDSRPY